MVDVEGDVLTLMSQGTSSHEYLASSILVWQAWEPDEVIIEFVLTLTNSKLNRLLTQVERQLVDAFPNAHVVRPGHWKPVTGKSSVPNVGTKHAKDAMRMALFWARCNVSPHVGFALDLR
jgi:hypothetical protein